MDLTLILSEGYSYYSSCLKTRRICGHNATHTRLWLLKFSFQMKAQSYVGRLRSSYDYPVKILNQARNFISPRTRPVANKTIGNEPRASEQSDQVSLGGRGKTEKVEADWRNYPKLNTAAGAIWGAAILSAATAIVCPPLLLLGMGAGAIVGGCIGLESSEGGCLDPKALAREAAERPQPQQINGEAWNIA